MPESTPSGPDASVLAVMDLHDVALMVYRQRRLVLTVTGLCLLGCLLFALVAPPRFRAEAVLMVDHREKSAASLLPGGVQPVQSLSTLRSDLDVIDSRTLADRVIDKQGLMDDPEFQSGLQRLNPLHWFSGKSGAVSESALARQKAEVAEALLKKLRASNDGQSFSIKVAFVSRDPTKAAQIANSFADEYLTDQLSVKYDAAARANQWLTGRLAEMRAKLETAEKAANDYRRAHNLLNAGGGTLSQKQLTALSAQLTAARGEVAQAEARLQNARRGTLLRGGIDSTADVLSSPLVQKLQADLAAAQRKAADISSRYGERHPQWIKAQSDIRDLRRKLDEESRHVLQSLAGEVSVARAKEAQLQTALNKLESKAGAESHASVQLAALQREADASRRLYEDYLNRAKIAGEQDRLQLPDARLIARADTPLEPVFPVPWLLLLVGLLAGVPLGLLAVYGVDGLDRGFKTSAEASDKTGLSVFGLMPILSAAPENYVLEKPLSAYAEALRNVETALRYSDVDHPPKTILVTSAQPGEGKSSFCLSFARLLAKAGKNILLIDADLRRPRLARMIGQKPTAGLADVLAGQKTLKDVLLKDAPSGLSLLPALGRTPNAQDLLGSGKMQALLQEVAAAYDYVLIDAPPILAVSDSAMAAQFADTTLLLARWSHTRQSAVARALDELRLLKARLAGLVLTQVHMDELALYGDETAALSARYYDEDAKQPKA